MSSLSAPSTRLAPLLDARRWLADSWFLPFTYLLFIAGFFIVPSSHFHNLFYYVFVLVPYALVINYGRLRPLLRSSVYRLSIGYLALLVISTLWAAQVSEKGLSGFFFHFLYLFGFLSLTIELILTRPNFLVHLYRTFFLVAAASGLVAALVFYSFDGHALSHRVTGPGRLENQVLAASVFGAAALIAYFSGFHHGTHTRFWRVVTILSALGCLGFSILTQSRGPLLALLVALLCGTFAVKDRKIVALLIFVITTYVLLDISGLVPLQRLVRGTSHRLEIWGETLPYITAQPWFGHGQGFKGAFHIANGKTYDHAHSIYISSLLYVGVAGTAIIFLLIATATKWSLKHLRLAGDFTPLALLVYSAVTMIFDGTKLLASPRAMWLFFWLPVAIACVVELQQKEIDRQTGMEPADGPPTT